MRSTYFVVLTAAVTIALLTACDAQESAPPDAEADGASIASITEDRSLDAPPDVQVGEWWTVEVYPEYFHGTHETTVVATERAGNTATFGMAADEFSDDLFVFHIPPMGEINLDTFAWMVMWDDFEALRFPLEEGQSWTADFHGYDVEAEVTGVEGNKAYVTMTGEYETTGEEERIELTYDAEKGMITQFEEEAIGLNYRVTDHGFHYEGRVKTPRGIELAMLDARPAEAMEALGHSVEEGASSTIDVDVNATHGSLGLLLWGTESPEEAATYHITATAPDGTTFEETFAVGPGDAPSALTSFNHDQVNGTWEIEYESDGPGVFGVEMFTYELNETQLDRAAKAEYE